MNIIKLTKRAWDIRRMAAKRFGKAVMSISWKGCLALAWEEEHPVRTWTLKVPYRAKEDAKLAGAQWNFNKKFWYFSGRELPARLEKFL